MRCTGKTKRGTKCRWPAELLVGGMGVCQFHVRQAETLWRDVRDRLPDDVRENAERDTRERNASLLGP